MDCVLYSLQYKSPVAIKLSPTGMLFNWLAKLPTMAQFENRSASYFAVASSVTRFRTSDKTNGMAFHIGKSFKMGRDFRGNEPQFDRVDHRRVMQTSPKAPIRQTGIFFAEQ
jgi:hypothetical protein